MHFAPGTIAAKKSRFRGWALALARLDIRRALRVRHRLLALPNSLRSLAFSSPGPVLAVLGLAFLATVFGLPIPLAGSFSPPAPGCGLALGATVASLGMGGMEWLLASLEQAQSLSRLSCPLTGSRLATSLMWAQGSCELPTAKPRMRSLQLRSEALLLITQPSWLVLIVQSTATSSYFEATDAGTTY